MKRHKDQLLFFLLSHAVAMGTGVVLVGAVIFWAQWGLWVAMLGTSVAGILVLVYLLRCAPHRPEAGEPIEGKVWVRGRTYLLFHSHNLALCTGSTIFLTANFWVHWGIWWGMAVLGPSAVCALTFVALFRHVVCHQQSASPEHQDDNPSL